MQVCTSLQRDNHASTPPLFFTGRTPFLPPNQQCQSTEGMSKYQHTTLWNRKEVISTINRLRRLIYDQLVWQKVDFLRRAFQTRNQSGERLFSSSGRRVINRRSRVAEQLLLSLWIESVRSVRQTLKNALWQKWAVPVQTGVWQFVGERWLAGCPLLCSLAVLDPRAGHTMDFLSPFISVLCHCDWLFHYTGSPVHVLMLSIQVVCGLPRLRAPGIVPCIISFSLVSSWCDHSMLASLFWLCLAVPSLLQLC